jgi:hypothetical protein
MLPAKIPNARIFSWGYDANTHSTSQLTAMYLYDHAQNLVSDLSLERRLTKVVYILTFLALLGSNVNIVKTERRPIIFVAHSLGGIVVKSVRYVLPSIFNICSNNKDRRSSMHI